MYLQVEVVCLDLLTLWCNCSIGQLNQRFRDLETEHVFLIGKSLAMHIYCDLFWIIPIF